MRVWCGSVLGCPSPPSGEDASLGFEAGEESGGRAGVGGCGRAGAGRTPGAAALPPERAAPAPLTRSKINMSVRGCHLVKGVLGKESISL